MFDKLLFDGDCWTVWTPCTLLRAGAGQHSKLQTGPSSNIRTPPGPGRGRHRHANCGFRHKQLYERATFFCILTFFGGIVGKIHLSRSLAAANCPILPMILSTNICCAGVVVEPLIKILRVAFRHEIYFINRCKYA